MEKIITAPAAKGVSCLIDELAKTLPKKEVKEEVLIKEAYLS